MRLRLFAGISTLTLLMTGCARSDDPTPGPATDAQGQEQTGQEEAVRVAGGVGGVHSVEGELDIHQNF